MTRATIAQDIDWFINGRTGISSKAIWCWMNRVPLEDAWTNWNHPSDPDDFSRCYLLLQRNPDWRARISEMAFVSKEWGALAERWDELERMFLDIVGGSFTQQDYDRRKTWEKDASERMYDRMRELEQSVEAPRG